MLGDALMTQRDPVVDHSLALEPVRHTKLSQNLDGVVLEQARPHALLDICAVAPLENHRLDPPTAKQQGEGEPGGASAHDCDLRPHHPAVCREPAPGRTSTPHATVAGARLTTGGRTEGR